MGGGYYDRSMDTSSSATSNATPSTIIGGNGLNPLLNPVQYKETNMVSTSRHPIVFALDVSGSMCDWPQIIYDKMPMFYGQIMMQGYLKDPSISFCAIADYEDDVIMQCSRFAKASDIDEQITKIHLGGGGGPVNRCEAYELPGYFYNYMVDLENCELPFFFLTCDEDFHVEISNSYIEMCLGKKVEMQTIVGKKIFKDLMKKFNLFVIKKPYNDTLETNENDRWIDAVGKERVLNIQNPKASIDLILGAIAVTNGFTLEKYIEDMRVRGQTEERIKQVSESLKIYYDAIMDGTIQIVKFEVEENPLSEQEKKMNAFYANFTGLTLTDNLKEKFENYEKVSKEFEGKIPSEYVCPLTKKLFLEPVTLYDGSVFEKQAIEKWFEKNDTNPITNEILETKTFCFNTKIQAEVEEYYNSVKDLI